MASTKTSENWGKLKARDIMRKDVITVSVNAPLSEVERVLGEHRISGVPVTDEAGHIVGVLSVRDLLERYAEDPDARPRRAAGFYQLSTEELEEEDLVAFEVPEKGEDTVKDIMNAEVFTISADAGLQEIARKMVELNIHRILVDEKKRHIGLISTMDILRALR
jgi:CBS domain-containing protein